MSEGFGFWLFMCVLFGGWLVADHLEEQAKRELQREVVTVCAPAPDPVACGRNVAAALKAAK